MASLHSRGVARGAVETALREIEVPAPLRAVLLEAAAVEGVRVSVVSDANTVFIHEILAANALGVDEVASPCRLCRRRR